MVDSIPDGKKPFTSMTGSSSRTFTPEFDWAFSEALGIAADEGDGVLTLERFLLRLLEEPEVNGALTQSGVDLVALRGDLIAFVQGVPKSDDGFSDLPDAKLTQVLRSTAVLLHSDGARNNHVISSLDFLAAIMRQGESMASDWLTSAGFTLEQATEIAQADSVSNRQQTERELKDTKARLNAFPVHSDGAFLSGHLVPTRESVDSDAPTNHYRITVESREADEEVEFKAAVWAGSSLQLLVESTPFEHEFVAREVIALFESVNNRQGISAALYATQSDGSEKKIGGFGGESGVILKNQLDLGNLRFHESVK